MLLTAIAGREVVAATQSDARGKAQAEVGWSREEVGGVLPREQPGAPVNWEFSFTKSVCNATSA